MPYSCCPTPLLILLARADIRLLRFGLPKSARSRDIFFATCYLLYELGEERLHLASGFGKYNIAKNFYSL